ncbi:hypothetical protein Mpsy_1749 [Methanolobus psychrophilus R15]|nr:hypothetical protein Mpsy_1749 [Methanolobus psychrophilus R15]
MVAFINTGYLRSISTEPICSRDQRKIQGSTKPPVYRKI